MKAGLPGNLG